MEYQGIVYFSQQLITIWTISKFWQAYSEEWKFRTGGQRGQQTFVKVICNAVGQAANLSLILCLDHILSAKWSELLFGLAKACILTLTKREEI